MDSVFLLSTDTFFVKLKAEKYALVMKEMFSELTDF